MILRFRKLLRTVFCSGLPLATLVACSGDEITRMPDRIACPPKENPFQGLTLNERVDGLAIARQFRPTEEAPIEVTRLDTLGTPCASASDRAECERKVEALFLDPSSNIRIGVVRNAQNGNTGQNIVAVVTTKDEVRVTTLPGPKKRLMPSSRSTSIAGS